MNGKTRSAAKSCDSSPPRFSLSAGDHGAGAISCGVADVSVVERICERAERQGFAPDAAQLAAAGHLQRLCDELRIDDQKGWLARLLASRTPARGVYLWGGVGRGKSFLMDAFFGTAPIKRKKRVHFHRFMHEIHAELDSIEHHVNPLAIVAGRIADQACLICFDEFHVDDIADAMLLGRLLQELLERGVVLVATSNYRPDDLYRHGLQRAHFLPTIALLKDRLDIVEVDGGVDFRLRALERARTYHSPLNESTEASLSAAFFSLAGGDGTADMLLEIQGRRIAAKRSTEGVAWFDFQTLCSGPRGQADYIEIARRYHTVFISGIPKIGPERAAESRRFTWLVDEFYDRRVKLVVSAAAPPNELCGDGPNAAEFVRTSSRLAEMQSKQYLAQPHLP